MVAGYESVGLIRVNYLTLCPSCHHTASLHHPDGCRGRNLQCDCMLGRDEVYASALRGETPRTTVRHTDSTAAVRRTGR
jgi:hypothetical protein